MYWTAAAPTEAGFYYWQNAALKEQSKRAVRVVQIVKYLNRDGFRAETLTRYEPCFACDLVDAPVGWWAGPLPQPL